MSVVNVLLLLSFCMSIIVGFWLLFFAKHNRSYIYLGLAVFSSAFWAAAIFQTIRTGSPFVGGFSFIFAGLIFAFLIFFLLSFLNKLTVKLSLAISVPTAIMIGICMVPNAVSGQIDVSKGYIDIVSIGPWLPLFYLYILLCIAALVYYFLIALNKLVGIRRSQLIYIVGGFIVAMMFGITFNLILPAFHYFRFNNFGPVFILILIGVSVVAGTKHYIYGTRVVLSELYAVLLVFISFVKLAMAPSLSGYILTVAVVGICYLFIQSVISEADKNIKLEKDKEELKKLDKMKDEFLMVATHELNTPVTVLRGKMSMILDEGFGNFTKEEKEYLQPIFVNIEKLGKMFREVLEVIKIDQKKMLLSREQTNLNKLITEIVKEAKKSEHHFDLEVDLPKEPIFLKIDRPKIKEVLVDILDNAIKYSTVNGAKGEIKISVSSEKGETIVSVKDNGVGLSGEDKAHLAEKFFQSKRFDSFSPMEQQGTGLSLYITKKIIEMHHGRIWVESKEGSGSIFHVSFKNS